MTTLIGSPRIDILRERHKEEIEIDVSSRVWAVFGTAIHQIIEESSQDDEEYLAEERIYTEINGWVISGQIDIQYIADPRMPNVRLIDWKTTSAFAVMHEKAEWIAQGNVYSYLVEREKGLIVESLEIGAIIRDWSRRAAERNQDYFQAPVVMIPLPLWSYPDRERYVLERVRIHQEADRLAAWGEDLPECTPDEMWERPAVWAVQRKGLKRATKLCNTLEEATALANRLGAEVEHRPGERVRCQSYCEVAPWCSQYKDYQESSV